MNINSLRKNYQNLTMLQRLALADNALGREDESEAIAIKNASPLITFTQPDFCELYGEILKMRLCNLITRLGYVMNFDFLLQAELEKLINKSSLTKQRRIQSDIKLAAFLYVRATDSWNAINEEFGLRTNFDEEIGEHLFSFDLLRGKDAIMRKLAFTESEARAYVGKKNGKEEFKTIEDEIEEFRRALKEYSD